MSSTNTHHASLSVRSYTNRAAKYDDSFHVTQAADLISRLDPRPGEHVLDLACGTGLSSFPAARAVGPKGSVTGVDVTAAMMDVARAKIDAGEGLNGAKVVFHEGDITKVDEPAERARLSLKEEGYDIVTALSVLPLMKDPGKAIQVWANMVRPGGRLMVDTPHVGLSVMDAVFEDVAEAVGRTKDLPYSRKWCTGQESMEELFLEAGLEIDESFVASGYDVASEYATDDDDELGQLFDKRASGPMFQDAKLLGDEKAKQVFIEGMRARAKDGKIKEFDGFYVVIGKKPEQ